MATYGAVPDDADETDLIRMRNVISWSFDEDLRIIAEDSYSGGPIEMRALADDEPPADFLALL